MRIPSDLTYVGASVAVSPSPPPAARAATAAVSRPRYAKRGTTKQRGYIGPHQRIPTIADAPPALQYPAPKTTCSSAATPHRVAPECRRCNAADCAAARTVEVLAPGPTTPR